MSLRRLFWLSCGALSAAALAFAAWPRALPAAPRAAERAHTFAVAFEPARRPPSRFVELPALSIENEQTREKLELKLYDARGNVDEEAAIALDQLLCDARKPHEHDSTRMNRRTLQLLFKAAYHFGSNDIVVVSAYRKPGRRREGPHATGAAIDFRLRDVKAAELAGYLRGIPKTGVGIYTHPKTQFVHLDSREHSFHWLDASPPRRHWREKSIGGRDLQKRDALYSSEGDWP